MPMNRVILHSSNRTPVRRVNACMLAHPTAASIDEKEAQ